MKIFKFALRFVLKKYFTFKFKNVIAKNKEVYVFDIDNTIANTWPSFLSDYQDDLERLSKLSIFFNMRNYIMKEKDSGKKIIYLTARPYKSYITTLKWLNGVGLIDSYGDLFLVECPMDKVLLFKGIKNNVRYFDDLTYNHENGVFKYYNVEIDEIKSLSNVVYMDYFEINKIVEGCYE